MNFLIGFILFLIVAIIIVSLFKDKFNMWYDEVTHETVTTTTTVHDFGHNTNYEIAGDLLRLIDDNGQPFVLDPVDKARWNLNTNDDMYEDADGKIWRLVN